MLYVDAPACVPLPPSAAVPAASDTPQPPLASLSLVDASAPADVACAAAPPESPDAESLEPLSSPSCLHPTHSTLHIH